MRPDIPTTTVLRRLIIPGLLYAAGTVNAMEMSVSGDGSLLQVRDGFVSVRFSLPEGRCVSFSISGTGEELTGDGGFFECGVEGTAGQGERSWKLERGKDAFRLVGRSEGPATVVKEFDFSHSPMVVFRLMVRNDSETAIEVEPTCTNHFHSPVRLRLISGEGAWEGQPPARIPEPARPWYGVFFSETFLGVRLEPGQRPRLEAVSGEGSAGVKVSWPRKELPPGGRAEFGCILLPLPSSWLKDLQVTGVGRGFVGGVREHPDGLRWRLLPFESGPVAFSTRLFIPGRRLAAACDGPVQLALRRGRWVEGFGNGPDGRGLSEVVFESETLGGGLLVFSGRENIPVLPAAGAPAAERGYPEGSSPGTIPPTPWAAPFYWRSLRISGNIPPAARDALDYLVPSVPVSSDLMVIDISRLPDETTRFPAQLPKRLLFLYPQEPTPSTKADIACLPRPPLTLSGRKAASALDPGLDRLGLKNSFPLPLSAAAEYTPAPGAEILLTSRDGRPLLVSLTTRDSTIFAAVAPSVHSVTAPDLPEALRRDYIASFLSALLLRAGGLTPEVSLDLDVVPADPGASRFATGVRPALNVSLRSAIPAAFQAELCFRIRNRWGEITEHGKTSVTVKPGPAKRLLECLYPLGGGTYFADVFLKHRGLVVNWACASVQVRPAGRILSLSVPEKSVPAGGSISPSLRFRTGVRTVVRLSLTDPGGNIVSTEDRLVEPTGEATIAPLLHVGAPDCSFLRVRASLYHSGIEMDRAESTPIPLIDRPAK